MRLVRFVVAAMMVAVFAGTGAPHARAVLPTTPTVEIWDGSGTSLTLVFYALPTSADHFWISCDGSSNVSDRYTWAPKVTVTLDIPGCEGYGEKHVSVQVLDAAEAPVFWGQVPFWVTPALTLSRPLPAITGHPYSFVPTFPDDYALPAGSHCTWEFRWGNDASLRNDYDETFGALGHETLSAGGACPAWTFTMPWVPYPQFEVSLTIAEPDEDTGSQWRKRVRFMAAVDGTARLIKESNLPIVQVLPSTYTPVVGQPVTYTRHLIGGATAGAWNNWSAWQGADPDLNHWAQDGGATFTIRPWETGNVSVIWQRHGGKLFYGMYDPPVRRPDAYRPTTTKPVARITPTSIGGKTVPVTLTWDGSDRGWGIAKYQLERRVDGGAWTRILSRKTKTLATTVPSGHAYQFRVRAVDKYGNKGYWDIGPAFRPALVEDGSTAIVYTGDWASAADATARGGSIREASASASKAVFAFTGRDVAWLAERGPGHGVARVYVDGALAATVDLDAAADAPARVVFRKHWATKAGHTVRIAVQGTASRPVVSVDGFAVLR
jgi:hypothetical protein